MNVIAIYIAAKAGDPMVSVETVAVVAGAGLQGDRYAADAGAWSKAKRVAIRHVTFIAEETVEAVKAEGLPLTAELTRRNILTRGVDLNALVGKTFRVRQDGPRFRGVELCDPCARPGTLSGVPALKAGLLKALEGRGGLRAEALDDGYIEAGDEILIE